MKNETRFVKSQKKGWVEVKKGDRDWNSGIPKSLFLKELKEKCKKVHFFIDK